MFGVGCELGIDCAENDVTKWYWRPFYLDEDHDSYGTGEIINFDSGQRLAWSTPDIINIKE